MMSLTSGVVAAAQSLIKGRLFHASNALKSATSGSSLFKQPHQTLIKDAQIFKISVNCFVMSAPGQAFGTLPSSHDNSFLYDYNPTTYLPAPGYELMDGCK